jgi:hypothetical protein
MYAVLVRISQYGKFRRSTLFLSSGIREQTRYTISVLRNFRSPWNRILLENVTVADLITKSLAVFYGNRGVLCCQNFRPYPEPDESSPHPFCFQAFRFQALPNVRHTELNINDKMKPAMNRRRNITFSLSARCRW